MRRIALAVLAFVLVAVSARLVWALPGSPPVTSSPEQRVSGFWADGPGVVCDGDSCGVGSIKPVEFTLDGDGTYSGTVSLSFGYLSTGDGYFTVAPILTTANRHVVGTLFPRHRVVAPAARRNSTTLVFHVSGLPAGQLISLSAGVELTPQRDPNTSFGTSNLDVELRVGR